MIGPNPFHTKYSFVTICKYLLLVAPMLGTLFVLPRPDYPPVISLCLLVLINSQLRQFIPKNGFIFASLIAETLLVLSLTIFYQGFLLLLFFAATLDAYMSLENGTYFITLLSGVGLAFSAWHQLALSYGSVIVGFYLIIVLFLLQLQKEFTLRSEMEALYDQIRKNHYDLELAKARLIEYSRQVEHFTQVEERNRISRELHDSIGHSLTGTLLQLDAAMKVLAFDKNKSQALLASVYTNLSNSIELVRTTVNKIRPVLHRPSTVNLRNMIERFGTTTGVNVALELSGTPYELYPSVETTLYQNIQEALTNSVRHGDAQNISVHLNFTPKMTEVEIMDDGSGCEEIHKGFGLSGMEERLELIGGNIEYHGQPNFQIHMRIPRREG